MKDLIALATMLTYLPAFEWILKNRYSIGTEELETNWILKNAALIRKNFWLTVLNVALLFFFVIGFIVVFGNFNLSDPSNQFRIIAAFIALSASISMATSPLGMWNQGGIISKMETTMYVISQIGATTILLLTLNF